MKLGEYLKEILKAKNISVSELARRLELTSRNELYRLFSGYHSYEKQKRMINAITAQVQFTPEETETLWELLKKSKEGEFAPEVKRILNFIYAADIKPLTVRRGSVTKRLS
ncbi:MAG: helix-turn-helix transcriptional regulator, partial [Firmicutes bacterium]|nr:helix-turn-helix transcriptional regulator [Bacillota bacterium]